MYRRDGDGSGDRWKKILMEKLFEKDYDGQGLIECSHAITKFPAVRARFL